MKKILLLIFISTAFNNIFSYDYILSKQNMQFKTGGNRETFEGIFYNPALGYSYEKNTQLQFNLNYDFDEYQLSALHRFTLKNSDKLIIGLSYKSYDNIRKTTVMDPYGENGTDVKPSNLWLMTVYQREFGDFHLGGSINWNWQNLLENSYHRITAGFGADYKYRFVTAAVSGNLIGKQISGDTQDSFPFRLNAELFFNWWQNQFFTGYSFIDDGASFFTVGNTFNLYKSKISIGYSNYGEEIQEYWDDNNIGMLFVKIMFSISEYDVGLSWSSETHGSVLQFDLAF